MNNEYATELEEWFNANKRNLPWRENRSAYKVLVSEIMLQQTRAEVVIPYFESWIKKFGDFNKLAAASEEEVIKAWEGLGYYSRARNLHTIAKLVVTKYRGAFPSDKDHIISFKGIGVYTTAAISHFVFNQRVLGADGNINRVMSRFYNYNGIIANNNAIINLMDEFLPHTNSKNCFEALIELGATICTKKAKCIKCPIASGCKSYIEGTVDLLPLVRKRATQIKLLRVVFVIMHNDSVLVKKEKKKLMNGLYEFPYIEIKKLGEIPSAKKYIEKMLNIELYNLDRRSSVKHSFTKYLATLIPIVCTISHTRLDFGDYEFIHRSIIFDYPFSSGHRVIMKRLLVYKGLFYPFFI